MHVDGTVGSQNPATGTHEKIATSVCHHVLATMSGTLGARSYTGYQPCHRGAGRYEERKLDGFGVENAPVNGQ